MWIWVDGKVGRVWKELQEGNHKWIKKSIFNFKATQRIYVGLGYRGSNTVMTLGNFLSVMFVVVSFLLKLRK